MKKIFYLIVLFASVAEAQIVNIPDANFKTKLIDLGVDTNSDGQIQNTEALVITGLNIANLGISSLEGIQYFTNLQVLSCQQNQITTLDVSPLQSLSVLDCEYNQLASLTLGNLPNLQDLFCYFNQLTYLDASGCPSLSILQADHNQLTSMNLKNGSIEWNDALIFDGNSNLQYICADDDQILPLQSLLILAGIPNAAVSSYCSFTPGGDYNTITGTSVFDLSNDGCDAADPAQSFIKMNINDGTNSGASFSNAAGNYIFYTQAGNFVLTPDIENPTFFNFSPPTATVNFPVVDNSVSINNFCISANGFHPDLEIAIAPIIPARPGFDAVYQIVYKNKGNQVESDDIEFLYNDNALDFMSATTAPDFQSAGTLLWHYMNLLPFENRSIYVTFHVNSSVDTPPVNAGDSLLFQTVIDPASIDETPADNTFNYVDTVVNSYDPNIKTALEGNTASPSQIGNYMHYVINFENLGTSTAQNIVVKDSINASMFDVSSLQLMNSSHPVTARITGNVVEFIFENINLAIGGHGNILLKLKTQDTLSPGDMVSNKADIFFDYNTPIETNLANTTFQSLSLHDNIFDDSISVYPNPAHDNINVKSSVIIKSLELYDVAGRLVQTKLSNDTSVAIDLSKNQSGVYFLKVTTDNGIKTEKIIKK